MSFSHLVLPGYEPEEVTTPRFSPSEVAYIPLIQIIPDESQDDAAEQKPLISGSTMRSSSDSMNENLSGNGLFRLQTIISNLIFKSFFPALNTSKTIYTYKNFKPHADTKTSDGYLRTPYGSSYCDLKTNVNNLATMIKAQTDTYTVNTNRIANTPLSMFNRNLSVTMPAVDHVEQKPGVTLNNPHPR